MKMITRLAILVVLLCGTPRLSPVCFAISGSSAVQQEIENKDFRISKKLKTKKRQKLRVKLPRNRRLSISGPKELFLSGLFTATVGAMMLLAVASSNEDADIGEIFMGILLSIVGTIALAVGGMAAIIGGIWWLFEKYGK